jgi:hypothetical protein
MHVGSWGGQAFLLVGAEPRNLVGTPRRDPAKLEDWLVPYLGHDGPVWDAHHVDVSGTEVLLFEIQPPREGDPIHTLRKRFDKWAEGTIFVRHKGKTDPATSVDVKRLSSRAAAQIGNGQIAVDVGWTTDDRKVDMLNLSNDDSIDSLVDSERTRLLQPLDGKGLAHLLTGVRPDLFRETRTPDQYKAEVDDYLERLRHHAPSVGLTRAIRLGYSEHRLTVRNPTESNFPQVQVVLEFPSGIGAYDPEAVEDAELPTPPRLWEQSPPLPYLGGTNVTATDPFLVQAERMNVRFSRIDIRAHDEGVRLAFTPIDLRPRASEETDPFHLFVADTFAAGQMQATWEATSTDANGVASGSLAISISDTPLKLGTLAAKRKSAEG